MELRAQNKLNARQLEALQLANQALNDPKFKAWFFDPAVQFTELALSGHQFATKQELWDRYFSDNKVIPVFWRIIPRPIWKRFSSEVGRHKNGVIFTYKQRFDSMSAIRLAAHLSHELMHVIGFSHSKYESQKRNNSLPYQVGDWVEAFLS